MIILEYTIHAAEPSLFQSDNEALSIATHGKKTECVPTATSIGTFTRITPIMPGLVSLVASRLAEVSGDLSLAYRGKERLWRLRHQHEFV